MDEEILIPISLFAAIFGMVYLYFSTRNKERLALIEKGADASIFNIGKRAGSSWKVIVINIAFLLMGIGLGLFIANVLESTTSLDDNVIYPAITFIMAGLGLYIGYIQTKKALDSE